MTGQDMIGWHGLRPRYRHITTLALACLLLSACQQESPETGLQHMLDRMMEAVHAHQTGGIMAHVAEDFSGQNGRIDRRSLHALLRFQMLRNAVIHVLVTQRDIALHGDTRAVVTLDVLLTGGAGLLPQRGKRLHLTTGWRYDGEWKVVNAAWNE